SGYPQAPLKQRDPLDGISSAFADAVFVFVIGQYCSECGAPVYYGFRLISDSILLKKWFAIACVHCFPLLRRQDRGIVIACGIDTRVPVLVKFANECLDRFSFSVALFTVVR